MIQAMTSRERILNAVSHRQPDRVPIDLAGTRSTGIVLEGYEKLRGHFGVGEEPVIIDRMQRLADVDEHILKALDIDTRSVLPSGPLNKGVAEELGPKSYRDIWGVDRVNPEGSYYYDMVKSPLAGEITKRDVIQFPWPDPDDDGYRQGLKERLSWARANTEAAAILSLPPPFVHVSQYMRGFEDWYVDFAANKSLLEVLFDCILEYNMEISRRILSEIGKDVDLIFCADDLGTQYGLMVRPDDFRALLKPRLAKYMGQIHEMSPAKVMFHTCGSVVDIIPDLSEIGIDILNPVQVSAAGMNPVRLKKEFGDKMVFWGAMDTQNILPFGTIDDVKKMVEARIEEMGEGGGFVLTSVHNIQPDVPLENILAMFQHAREYVPSYLK